MRKRTCCSEAGVASLPPRLLKFTEGRDFLEAHRVCIAWEEEGRLSLEENVRKLEDALALPFSAIWKTVVGGGCMHVLKTFTFFIL